MDYFNRRPTSAGTENNAANPPQDQQQQQQQQHPAQRGARYMPGAPSFESLRAPSNIRIRRLPSTTSAQTLQRRPVTQQSSAATPRPDDEQVEDEVPGRRRSSSAPQRPNYDTLMGQPANHLSRQRTITGAAPSLDTHMPAIREGDQVTPHGLNVGSNPPTPGGFERVNVQDMAAAATPAPERLGTGGTAMHSAGHAAQRNRGMSIRRFRSNTSTSQAPDRPASLPAADEYESDVIDLLDLIDPEVRTLGTLTNLQNSLFVPDLGGLVNRRPTYELSRDSFSTSIDNEDVKRIARSRAGTRASRARPPAAPIAEEAPEGQTGIELEERDSEIRRTMSISSQLSDSHFAVLPHGVSLEGWTDEDVAELNDHVRHLLHSKREGFKRSWKGFKKYISKPLGLFVFVYATLVTLFGAAWVFALIGWIYVGHRQKYIINVIDLVLVALFALIGDGLAPFRAVDTYHMCFIAHYHHTTWRLRRERNLPNLVDQNDLPDRRRSVTEAELEDAIDKEETAEFSVLSPKQQKRLQYHQAKFNKSHTFYKPHETATHHAFPLRHMVAAVVLLDCHSLLQVALGTCTWSIDYHTRPEALTATILSCSITCNIAAGIVISMGDHKTRKKDVLERIFRQGLTEQALRRMAKKHGRGEMALAVDPQKVESEDIKDAHQAVTQGPTSSKVEKTKIDGDAFYTPTE